MGVGALVRSQLIVEKEKVLRRSLLCHLQKVKQGFFKPKQPVKDSHIPQGHGLPWYHYYTQSWVMSSQHGDGFNLINKVNWVPLLSSILMPFLVFLLLEQRPS